MNQERTRHTLPSSLTLPPQTVRGAGTITRLIDECRAFGDRGVLVHGASLEASGVLAKIKRGADGTIVEWQHPGGEPTLDQVATLREVARKHQSDWVAAVGGGSVIDVAKAAAGLLGAGLAPVEYHNGAEIPVSRIPFLAVPTTAGTGSEATTVSVLTNADTGTKKSIRHPSFMPRLVILDPDLLKSCPASVIASSGMDAFSQAIESFVSIHATWLTDELALEAISLIGVGLDNPLRGENADVRQDLLEGSYLAGLALSNARLGIIHGLAHPLGARFHAPHGLVCAVCLAPALAFNREAMGNKYRLMSDALGQDLTVMTRRLLESLDIKSPFFGQSIQDKHAVVAEVLASGSTKSNPRPVSAADIEVLLAELFEVKS